MDIDATSAVVTGAASGLGAGAARALAARGVRVVVVDLDDERGPLVAEEIDGVYARADVTDPEAVTAAVECAAELAPLRALVNCAGIAWVERTVGRDGSYESSHDLAHFTKIVTVNAIGTFNCIRIAATAMGRNAPLADGERGAIVNTASVAAFDGQIGQAAYSASKGAVVGMTLPIARDLSVIGVRVNTIAPGLIDTPIYAVAQDPEAFKAGLRRNVLFPQRLGTPAEFASLALELVTNSYLNGEVIRLDAGARLPPK
jgi:NAD(P)-dependent dehydrogenase (short-subunit alcohol dehydrogenase family)